MKKIISIIMAISLLLLLFVGCGDNNETGTNSTNGTSNGFSTGDITFLNNDSESKYRVVRPDGSEKILPSTLKVIEKIKSVFGVPVRNVADTEDGTDMYEILIGKTNRKETSEAKRYMLDNNSGFYDDWIICSIGKKIVIYSDNEDLLATATEYFCNNFILKDGVKGGICYFNKSDSSKYSPITINDVNIGKFSIVRPHYNSSYMTQLEMEELVDMVYNKTGYMLEIVEDVYVSEGDFEIVVGNTNRANVKKLDNYENYDITVSGKKVYLNGGNTYSTAMAVSEFTKLLSNGSVNDKNSTGGTYKTAIKNYDLSKNYRLVWCDDFDGTTVDPTKWVIVNEEYWEFDPVTGTSGQNGKMAWRKPENVRIANGMFHSILTQDAVGYYSGTIRTNELLTYKYGYVETSAKLPHGNGFWSTLWMRSLKNADYLAMPEIDVNECYGNTYDLDCNLHAWPSKNNEFGWDEHKGLSGKFSLPKTDLDDEKLSDGFHTYGVVWDENTLKCVGDGKVYHTIDLNKTGREIFKAAYNDVLVTMHLSASCGFSNCPLPMTATEEEWKNSNIYYVDYVHLYQLDDGKSVIKADNPFKY